VSQTVIEINQLTKDYESNRAVDHLSLTINRGEIFGLLGPNGAGKSTTILMLLGLSEPSSGSVRVCGYDSTKEPIEVKKRVGYLPDRVGFYEDRTGLENLIFTASLNGIAYDEAKKRAEQLLEQVGLIDVKDKKTGTYSRGMKQRLGLADVLMKDPEVIILDEPTLGIDPKGISELLQLIRKLSKEKGITILLSSHQLHQVQQICDRVGLFVQGKLIAEGDIQQLAEQLFADEPFTLKLEVSPVTEELIEQLRNLEGIVEITHDNQWVNIKSKEDLSKVIAKQLIEMGYSLHQMIKKNVGLDEIYQRYFEGGVRSA